MKNIQKLVLVPIEKWEKLGLKEPAKEILVKTVPLKDQSFQKKPISQVKNQQGQGIQKKMMIPQKFPQLSLIKKNKGLELLKLLRKNDNIKFNKKGEICYKGKLLKRSNVYDLINHAIHTNRSHPVHMKNFYKILDKIIIPNKLIKNKEGKNIMNKAIHDIDTRWRPPGLFYHKAVYLRIDRDHLYLDIFCYDVVSSTSSEISYHICDSGTKTL